MLTLLIASLILGVTSALSLPRQAEPIEGEGCTRDLLARLTESYLSAQTIGDPSILSPSPEVSYTEDFRAISIRDSVLNQPLRIDHNRSLLDTTQCATYTEIIVTDPANPRVIGTQIRLDAAGENIVKIETLATKEGDWAFNASLTYQYASRETTNGWWFTIPEADRDTRETVQAAADAYLDLFNDPTVVVPWGTPCNRLEGSWYTGNGSLTDSCNVGVPSGVPITQRRYVIDETVGTVDAFVLFGTRPDSHEFRIEKGKLRLVHTLTVMRNGTFL
ncbi:hypothetical protein QBC40DRAFT_223610 [Triangularia verruculosa]|uniref:DUF8021 domain-containing protein n=1 Tax=Triangularia verruculosa TaxID=2587418 RepID=A0AAN6XIP0_9PEZI|nr:hypothetical protein QBC40DRAFT_223610 [Triangularia verruculosa]